MQAIRPVSRGNTKPSILLRREIYVSAAALAAGVFVGLSALGLAPMLAGLIGAGAGFALRAGALAKGWALPGYREG